MSLLANIPGWIIEISDHLKTQEICNEAMRIEPLSLTYVPDNFKTQEMCTEAVQIEPNVLACAPDDLFKTQEMCNEAVSNKLQTLRES